MRILGIDPGFVVSRLGYIRKHLGLPTQFGLALTSQPWLLFV
jgi:hypothetical protein